jgi:hypothetical protein
MLSFSMLQERKLRHQQVLEFLKFLGDFGDASVNRRKLRKKY